MQKQIDDDVLVDTQQAMKLLRVSHTTWYKLKQQYGIREYNYNPNLKQQRRSLYRLRDLQPYIVSDQQEHTA